MKKIGMLLVVSVMVMGFSCFSMADTKEESLVDVYRKICVKYREINHKLRDNTEQLILLVGDRIPYNQETEF